MQKSQLGLIAALLIGVIWSGASSHAASPNSATAELKGRDGRPLGTARFVETMAGLLITLKLKSLPPGPHGLHVTEIGRCEGDFESAGAIYNPLGAKHGFLNEEGPMAGDLPNLIVAASGDVEVELLSPFLMFSKQGDDALLDADGAAIIVREKADDHRTDPDGESGARIACGVIAATK